MRINGNRLLTRALPPALKSGDFPPWVPLPKLSERFQSFHWLRDNLLRHLGLLQLSQVIAPDQSLQSSFETGDLGLTDSSVG